MKLRYDSISFIFRHGDEIMRLHLLQLLDMLETKAGKDLLMLLLKWQMPSGGFPAKFDEKTEGIRETCRNAMLLLQCGIPHDRLNIQSAINYLLRNQRRDGGWSENPNLTIPEHAIELSGTKSITWLTGDIVRLLRSAKLGKSKSCIKALNWLREMQNQRGGWSMFRRDQFGEDPDSTAQILFMMREIFGENDTVWLKGAKLFEKLLDERAVDATRGYYVEPSGEKRENDIYHLTHLLLSSLVDSKGRIEAGYDISDVRVKKIVQAILNSQHEDGGWHPFWTQDSDPTYTALTVKLLVWLDVLNPEELKKKLKSILG